MRLEQTGKRARRAMRHSAILVAILAAIGIVGATGASASTPSVLSLGPGLSTAGSALTGIWNSLAGTYGATQGAYAAVGANVQPQVNAAAANLSSSASKLAADAAAENGDAIDTDAQAAVTSLQTQALGELSSLESIGLSQGLSITQQVLSPTCSLLALPTTLTPGIGASLTRFYPLSSAIQDTDAAVTSELASTYQSLYDTLLGDAQSALGPAGAALTLLKYDWTTTYYPPNGGAPVVHDTPALLDVPTPIEVDGSAGYDLCGLLTLGSGGQIVEQITKLPLAQPVLPVDASAALLGVINLGYQTHSSTAPLEFTSTIASANGATTVDNSYALHSGSTLELPPSISLSSLLTLGGLRGTAPPPALTQDIAIGSGGSLALHLEYDNEPTTTHVALTTSGATDLHYTGSAPGDKFLFTTTIGSLNLGTGATPAPTAFDLCYSTSSGSCSNAPASETATDTSSLSFTASEPVAAEQYQTAVGDGSTCPAVSVLDAHLSGTEAHISQTPGSSTASSGKFWVDSGGQPVSGCVALGGITATLPTGFEAGQRQGIFHTTSFGLATAPDAKSGTISCPSGTAIAVKLISVVPVVCSFPPANTAVPTISGQAYVGATLTAGNGAWTPGSPNTPAFTYQWQLCDGTGANCANIAGATAGTYTLPVGNPPSASADLGKTLRVVVTAANLDGSARATSAATSPAALPPAPVNTAAPKVAGVLGTGHVLSAGNGTWTNGVGSFAYQWQRCAGDGTGCADIGGATAGTYTPVGADETRALVVVVTATNIGGSASASSPDVVIPGAPANTDPPVINDGSAAAAGRTVLDGDHLTVTNGSWQYASSFAYQWERCDAGAANCAPIAGATNATYVVGDGDVGSTIAAIVTGQNPNASPDGSADGSAAATGEAIANNLALKSPVSVPDGTVNATAPSGSNTTYVGGSFDTVGPPVGGAGAVSLTATAASSGITPSSLAAAATGGPVEAVVSDGSGGYFLGGAFTEVQGTACPSLAHILATGALDPTFCSSGINGEVRALSLTPASASNLLAVGGSFTAAGHQNLAFYAPGSATPLFPGDGDPNAAVNAIASNGTAGFYIGGDFTAVGGASVGHLVLETATGTGSGATIGRTVAWPASVCAAAAGACQATGATVKAMLYSTVGVMVGGTFNSAYLTTASPPALTTRNDAASFGTGTGAAIEGWNPNADGQVDAITAPPAPASGTGSAGPYTIYLGGAFTHLGSTAASHLGEFGITILGGSPAAGAANNAGPSTSFNPAPNGTVTSLVPGPGTGTQPTAVLYVGGSFTSVFGQSRYRLAAINGQTNTSTTAATLNASWAPNAGNDVLALARDASNVLVGGRFEVLGGVTRSNIAEISPTAGVTGWNPGADGPVDALATAGGVVYAGGAFAHAGGAARANLAALDPSGSGSATGWNPGADGAVDAILPSGGSVYVGGSFASVGGQPRANLAAIDAGSGSATGWNPGADGTVDALAGGGGTVYVGGSFANVGGQPRANIAAIDAGSGAATDWNPGTDGPVRALAATSSAVYAGGAFANVSGAARANVAAIDPGSGAASGWDPSADSTVRSLLPVGGSVYAGGDFDTIGGQPRGHAAALDGDSGAASSFDPGLDGSVRTLSLTSAGSLTVGGSFVSAPGTLIPGLAFFGG